MIGLIINPISGVTGGAHAGGVRMDLARQLVSAVGADAEIVLTTARGDATRFAQTFVSRNFDRVIGWGGDGTMNEIAGPLYRSRTALGIVPSGSGNGLARSLGLPRDPERALRTALERPVAAVDVGFLGDRHFLNVGGIGFDASVARDFNAGVRRGVLRYVIGGLSRVWSYRSEPYDITLGDETLSGERFLIAFANGREYGNGIVLAVDADPMDGWLDVVVMSGGSVARQFWRASRALIGRRKPVDGVYRTRVTDASVSGPHLLAHVDGETFETSGTLNVRIDPGAIRIVGAGPAASGTMPTDAAARHDT